MPSAGWVEAGAKHIIPFLSPLVIQMKAEKVENVDTSCNRSTRQKRGKAQKPEEEPQKTDFHGYCQQITKARAGGGIKDILKEAKRETGSQPVATAMDCVGKAEICLSV